MLIVGWAILLSFLLAFVLFGENLHTRRRIFSFGLPVTITTSIVLHSHFVFQNKDPVLFAMIFHIPLFFAYSVAFWCHINLLRSALETLAAYFVVSLLYLFVKDQSLLFVKDQSLLDLALILTAMFAQWLITVTYFQMPPDDFIYDDAA
ncbi:hypothetical protein [Deinococcus sp.]|uniref:hypothetical protein n=1 Tax=Deinococcus sp. TaxID=47478 RepID=UPI0025FF39CE|nr:hypothetical protein [Deinococcus sp.]